MRCLETLYYFFLKTYLPVPLSTVINVSIINMLRRDPYVLDNRENKEVVLNSNNYLPGMYLRDDVSFHL